MFLHLYLLIVATNRSNYLMLFFLQERRFVQGFPMQTATIAVAALIIEAMADKSAIIHNEEFLLFAQTASILRCISALSSPAPSQLLCCVILSRLHSASISSSVIGSFLMFHRSLF